MKKPFIGLVVFFIFLTTYSPKFNLTGNFKLFIKKIEVQNNLIIETKTIKDKLNFLYKENLFFLNVKNIEKILEKEVFLKSFSIKKIYPTTIKLIIKEHKPIAILQDKKKKFYILDNGNLIKFQKIKLYEDLPVVFGNGRNFFSLYKNLQNIDFPIEMIKSFYFFESNRWDLIMNDSKVVKLPIKDYLLSLQNFMLSKDNSIFNNHKIFDYRIKDQLILN